jgi:hypothetical protein
VIELITTGIAIARLNILIMEYFPEMEKFPFIALTKRTRYRFQDWRWQYRVCHHRQDHQQRVATRLCPLRTAIPAPGAAPVCHLRSFANGRAGFGVQANAVPVGKGISASYK